MNWANGSFGWWLLLIPAGIVLVVFIFLRSEKIFKVWLRSDEYKFYDPVTKLVLRISGLVLLGIALIGPYWGRVEQKVSVLGREIYLVVDVSASMNAEDIKPSRLEKVKRELKVMVSELRGDKVGLIVFTSNAYVQCPLTDDFNAVNLFIDLIQTDQFANTGTKFRAGLSMALERFTNTEKSLEKITRSIVLISDGEDFGSGYTSVLDRLTEEEITVFAVGIGTNAGAPVPNIVLGQKRGYKKDANGQPALSKLEDKSLLEIADVFGTEYFKLNKQIKSLKPVTEQIKLLSASVMDSKVEQVNNNRYQWFAVIGLICLVLSMVWMPIRSKKMALK